MSNLLNETIEKLKENKKTQGDVKWVGTTFGCITWKSFKEFANREYDSGFGGTEVNDNLMIVGDNWWLERYEYDGSEWWEYKEYPRKPKKTKFAQFFSGEYEFND